MGNFSWTVDFELTLVAIKANLVQYLLGSVVLAITASVTLGFLTYLLLPVFRKRKKQ